MRLSEFFYLHKSDRQVLLTLLLVAVVVLGMLFLAGGGMEPKSGKASDSIPAVVDKTRPSSPGNSYYRQEERKVERFVFDPNTADSTQLLRLGLQPWQVRNIYKYRAAGGVYRKKEDFARLYGLTVKQYRELEPYIRISSDYLPASTLFKDDTTRRELPYHSEKITEEQSIDLTVADTVMLKKVPGIGSYYARRIVQYRDRLGGYVSVDQLDEIEDFPMESKKYFVIEASEPQKLNLNRLSLNELKRHPYINYYQARSIVDYRRQHGPLLSLDDLRLLPDFPQETIDRLLPYVAF